MTTVVSDTSPLNYLILIEAIDVLPKLFEEVLIPPAVYSELQRARTPLVVREWVSSLPSWAKIRGPSQIDPAIVLGPGETEAISLALELRIPAVLIDERKGRLVAERRGILPVGTLNVLYSADLRGFLDFEVAVKNLTQTTFHVDPTLVNDLVGRVRLRKSTPRPNSPPDPI